MANISKWSNVRIYVQSAIASVKTISGLTLASPGVATSSSHGYSNGDYFLISATGMSQVDQRIFRAASVATDTFQLEGENTTAYDAWGTGGAYKLTFGTSLSTLTSLSASGGDFEFLDATTIHDNVKKQLPGAANPSTYTFESIWDVADAGLVALKAASDTAAQKAIKFVFSNGQILLFTGYIGATLLPTGTAQDIVKTSVTITAFGRPTVYAS